MTIIDHLPTEMLVLGLSVLLLLVHIGLQGSTVTRERGSAWNAGARDGPQKPLGEMAGRAARALANFQETWPAFIALALGLAVTGQTGGAGAIGAIVWIVARVIYVPLYLFGIAYVRTACWMVSMVGLLMMLWRFF